MSGFEETLNKILSSPEDMAKIAEIAKSFGAGNSSGGDSGADGDNTDRGDAPSPLAMLGSLDPKLLASLGRLIGEYSGKSDKAALLDAIAPYLKDEQRDKLTRASEIAKIAKIARIAMKEFNIGGGVFGV